MVDESQALLIDCPAHPGKHWAVLDVFPMPWAGTWECPAGESGDHDHEAAADAGRVEIEIETVEPWPTGPNDDPPSSEVYVCAGPEGCGIAIEGRYPEEDRAQALADMQQDNWRDDA